MIEVILLMKDEPRMVRRKLPVVPRVGETVLLGRRSEPHVVVEVEHDVRFGRVFVKLAGAKATPSVDPARPTAAEVRAQGFEPIEVVADGFSTSYFVPGGIIAECREPCPDCR